MSDGITDAYKKLGKNQELQMEIQRLHNLNDEVQETIENITRLLGEDAKEELDKIIKRNGTL